MVRRFPNKSTLNFSRIPGGNRSTGVGPIHCPSCAIGADGSERPDAAA